MLVTFSIDSMETLNDLVKFASEKNLKIQIDASNKPVEPASSKPAKPVKDYSKLAPAEDTTVVLHMEPDGLHFRLDSMSVATMDCVKKHIMSMDYDKKFESVETYVNDYRNPRTGEMHKAGSHKHGAYYVLDKSFLPKDGKVEISAEEIEEARRMRAERKAKKANK